MGIIKVEPEQPGRLMVQFSYSPERVAAIKTVSGRWWHPKRAYWTIPHTAKALAKVQACFPSDRVVVDRRISQSSLELPAAREKELIVALDEDLTLRGYSPRTRETYRLHLQRFLNWLGCEPKTAEASDLQSYLLDMLDSGLSASYARQARATLVILYRRLLEQSAKVAGLPCAKDKQSMPLVLSRSQVRQLLQAAPNLRDEVFLTIVYSAGLRVSEAIRLRVDDILAERGQIRVRNGKGQKDRYTVLADKALSLLREYYRAYRPEEWVFPGKEAGRHISRSTAQRIFEHVREEARLSSQVTLHTLRHSFATHMLENGANIRYIQEILGHRSIETTQRYTHVSRRRLAEVRSPLDHLDQVAEGA